MNKLIGILILLLISNQLLAEKIGSVDTVFKLLGPDHKIVIEAFDDPDIEGITCHLSRAKKGGVSGAIGVAEDPAHSSIACRQIGPIRTDKAIENGDSVFSKRTSFIFKELHVVRFLDEKRQVLIYLIYSDKVIEGSREHALSTVPIMPWGTQPAQRIELDD